MCYFAATRLISHVVQAASAAIVTMLLATSAVQAAATAQQSCEAAKNRATGKYLACRHNADAKLAVKADTMAYTDAITRCKDKLSSLLTKADLKAAGAGASCPDAGIDPAELEAVIDECSDDAASALAGARFEDTGLTVIDHLNGLEWEKKTNLDGTTVVCPGGGISCNDPHDGDNVYQYNPSTPYAVPNGSAFVDFLAALNRCTAGVDLVIHDGFAGHCDWRIPSIAELQTIVDTTVAGCGSGTPCIEAAFAPTSSYFRGYLSTTLSPDVDTSGILWVLPFSSGVPATNETGKVYSVRAVRSR